MFTDIGEDSKLVHRRKRQKVDAGIFFSFFRRVRATSMTQCRVENTRVHFWTFSPVSVKLSNKIHFSDPIVYYGRLVDYIPCGEEIFLRVNKNWHWTTSHYAQQYLLFVQETRRFMNVRAISI